MNPFFHSYQTPYNIPPFEGIEDAHFREAFIEGMREQELEYEKIENNLDTPTFENTLLAIERSGSLLKKVSSVFDNLVAANTNDTLNALDVELTPKRAEHRNRFWLSTDMFARIDALYQSREQLGLTPEQLRLLEERHRTFVQKGVQLPVEKRARLKEISKRISSLQVAFQQNLLKEKQNYSLIVETIEELEGIPADIVAAASETAARAGHAGKWIFKATQGTLYAVLTYAQNRNLRKELYEAYVNRGNRGDEYDNNAIAVEMASLRLESAQILGYANYAEYGLSGTMAKTSDRVLSLLKSVWTPAIHRAKQERAEMQRLMGDETFQGWDWWFYAEKIRKAKYDISENSVRPYFTIDNVRDGAFSVAQKLFGIRFVERDDLPKYHEDVRTFEVKDRSDTVIGLFYCDYFTRPSKSGGAWMSAFRKQSAFDGVVIPIVINVCNFPPPTADSPSLLTATQLKTLFHELGHGLHGLLSQAQYPYLSGTSVTRDYVEFPSQMMENWGRNAEVIKGFARHYQSGEVIPDGLLRKLKEASTFNMGFVTTEYIAASYLDMSWHMLESIPEDPQAFEKETLGVLGLIPEIASRYRTTYFAHIFAGGYCAGYYSYIWSEVLDSDAFSLFETRGLFDQKTAEDLLQFVYSAGNTADVLTQYVRFRGSEPKIDALLRNRGLSEASLQ